MLNKKACPKEVLFKTGLTIFTQEPFKHVFTNFMINTKNIYIFENFKTMKSLTKTKTEINIVLRNIMNDKMYINQGLQLHCFYVQ
jgi:hypothetical protein